MNLLLLCFSGKLVAGCESTAGHRLLARLLHPRPAGRLVVRHREQKVAVGTLTVPARRAQSAYCVHGLGNLVGGHRRPSAGHLGHDQRSPEDAGPAAERHAAHRGEHPRPAGLAQDADHLGHWRHRRQPQGAPGTVTLTHTRGFCFGTGAIFAASEAVWPVPELFIFR